MAVGERVHRLLSNVESIQRDVNGSDEDRDARGRVGELPAGAATCGGKASDGLCPTDVREGGEGPEGREFVGKVRACNLQGRRVSMDSLNQSQSIELTVSTDWPALS